MYKLAVLTYKVRSTSTPVYLHRRIAERACSRTLRSAAVPLLDKPFMRTAFSKRAFRFSAPTVWKTFLFNQAFTEHWSDLPPAPLKLRPYGAIEIRLLLLLLSTQAGADIQAARTTRRYSRSVTLPPSASALNGPRLSIVAFQVDAMDLHCLRDPMTMICCGPVLEDGLSTSKWVSRV